MSNQRTGIGRMAALIGLGGLAIALAMALAGALISLAAQDDLSASQRKALALFGAVSGVLLVVVVTSFAMFAIHLLSQRLVDRKEKPEPTPYVNAWEIAGQRLKLDEEDSAEPPAEEDQPPPA